jgi:hypothetical protein
MITGDLMITVLVYFVVAMIEIQVFVRKFKVASLIIVTIVVNQIAEVLRLRIAHRITITTLNAFDLVVCLMVKAEPVTATQITQLQSHLARIHNRSRSRTHLVRIHNQFHNHIHRNHIHNHILSLTHQRVVDSHVLPLMQGLKNTAVDMTLLVIRNKLLNKTQCQSACNFMEAVALANVARSNCLLI